MVALSGPFRPVSRLAPVVSRGAVAAERSPPICEGEMCGVSSPAVRLMSPNTGGPANNG